MARKQQALSYLPFTLTQGGADAFIQASISTALSGLTKTCYRLSEILLEFPSCPNVLNDMQFALTRKSYAAMATSMVLEKSMIAYYRRQANFTTSGMIIFERTVQLRWADDDAPILVEDPLYAQFDTASTSATNVLYGRIGYWQDSISEVDRLTLIANSLS